MSVIDHIDINNDPFGYSGEIQAIVSAAGFDWDSALDIIQALKDEVDELEEAVREKHSQRDIELELGDVLFTCVNLARHLGTTVHHALDQSNQKFTRRFRAMETLLEKQNLALSALSFDALLDFWAQAKKLTRTEEALHQADKPD
ncbi:MAG: hypothetical protein COV52_00920 [Gammaproteobacteria bacterium CG11_big_fil_rev_8_21_14_0_20_46_22]|nr:MAG: hypothetical protein COW05_03020 [Gammaproteobacteria bacterium CG12_big_fil_rev_8_21_14_0_65_46_12]PIR11979.1 MAG: hypothetical protein COV52_00920 [Gammaproteobacteria bacterium CG11_big_fil_rev_8_21_14_0_20_46_22]